VAQDKDRSLKTGYGTGGNREDAAYNPAKLVMPRFINYAPK